MSTGTRVIYRIRVDGTNRAADRLREYLHAAGFRVVDDTSAAYRVSLQDGAVFALDSVDSPLEQRIEMHLEELSVRFGCGAYVKQRAGGNRNPNAAVITVPDEEAIQEGTALAVFRAIEQVSVQPRARRWWLLWLGLLSLLL